MYKYFKLFCICKSYNLRHVWIPQGGLVWPTAEPTVVKLYTLIKHILKANIVIYQSSHVHQNQCSGSKNKEVLPFYNSSNEGL